MPAQQLFYSGTVQGVGFRLSVLKIARQHPTLTGWVRNLSDGRVEVQVAGEEGALEAFIAAIATSRLGQLYGHLEQKTLPSDALADLHGFEIYP